MARRERLGTVAVLLAALLGVGRIRPAPAVDSDEEAFTVQHSTGTCLSADADSLRLVNCSDSASVRWKWGGGHRLFHVASSKCLGLEVLSKRLQLLDCDQLGTMMTWDCLNGGVFTVYEMSLSRAENGVVVAKRGASDVWVIGGTDEDICQRPYRVTHTTEGNSFGKPCMFPFRYQGVWYHRCLPGLPQDAGASELLPWCSTTLDFDQDKNFGFCLQKVDGCAAPWLGPVGGRCYLAVPSAAVTWHEARDSCRSQGGDLLSVSSTTDLSALHDLPDRVWTGLNQLDWQQGWQWADASPLSFVHWARDMPSRTSLSQPDCGLLNSNKTYENLACERKLPYVCRKAAASTPPESAGRMVHYSTLCEDGWFAWNGRCLKLFEELQPQEEAQRLCETQNSTLVSVHSLEDIEMVSTVLPDGRDVWSGLKGEGDPLVFKWLDGTNVTFTYWERHHPSVRTLVCVHFTGKDHMWIGGNCELKLPFLCLKAGQVNESSLEEGCPAGDWRRHGNACYRVDPTPVPFKNSCGLTITSRFEQAFINSLLKEHTSKETHFFWTGLQDIKNNGEYVWVVQNSTAERVTYTNWAWQEPVQDGGCAVLSTSRFLGKWMVKNCSRFTAGSICKTLLSPLEPPEPESDITAECPQGWTSIKGIKYCYKVFHEERLNRKRSWLEAEDFCQALGAHLASVSHPEEMNALDSVMRASVSDERYFWVGLNRRNPNNDNTWEWSDGRPVSTSIFSSSVHQDDEYNRDCAAIKSMRRLFYIFFLVSAKPYMATPFHCDAQLEWVCQIPRGSTPKTPEWYNPEGRHGTSTFLDGQEFWFVQNLLLSYEEASMYCTSNSSRLAHPQSFSAIHHLQSTLLSLSGATDAMWWVDLRDTVPFPSLYFRFTQMRFYEEGQCRFLTTHYITPDTSTSCSSKLPFVCEALNVTSVEREPIGPHPTGLPCDGGSIAFRDKCYTVTKPQYTNFRKASEVCSSHRGTLLTITDQVEQDFIVTLLASLPEKMWIGLRLRFDEMLWVDGTPVDFVNFHPLIHGQYRVMRISFLEPEGLELCTYMFNDPSSSILGTWDYSMCSEQQSVSICQHYADHPDVPVFSDRLFHLNNHTFKLVQQENLTWFAAWELCKKQDMDLASVADAFQQAVLSVNVSRFGSPMWIGFFSEDDGTHFRWTDHSHTIFSRWSSQETSGRCVYLDIDGYWKATECNVALKGAICHVPHNDTIAPQEVNVQCPHKNNGPNWIPFKKNCYSFLLMGGRWDAYNKGEPEQSCQELDPSAKLLSIRSAEENEFVQQQLLPLRDLAHFVWLGIKQDSKAERLKWYDGTYVHFSNWEQGRPDVAGDFLAGLAVDGSWALYTNPRQFASFQQRSALVCKMDNDPKEEFQKSPTVVEEYGSLNYYVVAQRLSWFQAQEECGRRHGHLASVHNTSQSQVLQRVVFRDGFPLWIGLSNQDASNSVYEWSDGTALDYVPPGWTSLAPTDRCVYVDPAGRWSGLSCQEQVEGAVCYNSSSKRSSAQVSTRSENCPKSDGLPQWVHHNDHCYAFDMNFYNYSVYTMEDAKRFCGKLDSSAQLLTIKSEEENQFVSDYVSENPHITNRIWLGLDWNAKDQKISWVDGSSLDFSKWKSAALTGVDSCAALLSAHGGVWAAVSCTDARSRVVCKAPTRSASSPVALALFLIVIMSLAAAVLFIVYKRNRGRFSSTIRYQRNYDEADSTSIINETE
ncbi:lymphocyte antigen 75 isoform X2 [Denticeps clupeoides]|uniref:lymphocyte antigen 75 isoform X2 n=1 Tax=Denticeps clupeoides TaxID=299321 RepID=UPI0010A47BF5|nr:lymphocyte antigen 75-like isoform X2 [Denticeps clupeoides]